MKAVLLVNIVALVVAAVTASSLAWANRASTNVVFAGGALLGAIALYGVQLSFELRRTTRRDHISAEYTIDRSERWIRQWEYPERGSGGRAAEEITLGRSLAQAAPTPFDGDRESLTRDFMIRSLVLFLARTEFDWQLDKTVFRGSSGTLTMLSPVSTKADSTLLGTEAVRSELKRSGNLFGSAPLFVTGGYLRLPPKSSLRVERNFLVVRNPLLEISFTTELPGSVSFTKPKTGGLVEALPNGDARYESRWVGLKVERTFFALRAHDADAAKYLAWSDRLVSGVRDWFEGGTSDAEDR